MNRRSTLFSIFASALACICRTGKSNDYNTEISKRFGERHKAVTQLQEVLQFPQGFMFADHVLDKVDAQSFITVQSTANEENGKPQLVEIRSGTMRIFRAHDAQSADGEHGEIKWTVGTKSKTTRIHVPNAIVLAVRSLDGGEVSWYTLTTDFRC